MTVTAFQTDIQIHKYSTFLINCLECVRDEKFPSDRASESYGVSNKYTANRRNILFLIAGSKRLICFYSKYDAKSLIDYVCPNS